MRGFLSSLEREIAARGLLPRGRKILVAVSGGVDSMVLLHALDALAGKNLWEISLAHFNHQLRGRASAADEKLVRKTAADLGLKFFVGRADVKKFAEKSKASVEMAARKLRHEFLARTAKSQNISAVALAQHADDQVELFFLRVLRGAGGEGLAGMKWLSPSPAGKKISLVRPLLNFTKNELLDFARENKIRFRADATNASPDFLRNRIRHELLPLLQKNYQPGLAKTVLRLMEITGAEAGFVGETAELWLAKQSGPRKAAGGKNGAGAFQSLSVAVQRKVLQRQLLALGVSPDFERIEQLRKSAGKWVSVNPHLAAARDAGGKIQLADLGKPFAAKFNPDELKLKLSGRVGRVSFGGRRFNWTVKKTGGARGRPRGRAGREFFDADKLGEEIILRHWRAGDRFQPIGLRSPVKLQDLFVNEKIPRAQRRDLVLAATAAGEIFWVEGLRIGERFKLAPETRRKLIWGLAACSTAARNIPA